MTRHFSFGCLFKEGIYHTRKRVGTEILFVLYFIVSGQIVDAFNIVAPHAS